MVHTYVRRDIQTIQIECTGTGTGTRVPKYRTVRYGGILLEGISDSFDMENEAFII